jgi:hypothetical protein
MTRDRFGFLERHGFVETASLATFLSRFAPRAGFVALRQIFVRRCHGVPGLRSDLAQRGRGELAASYVHKVGQALPRRDGARAVGGGRFPGLGVYNRGCFCRAMALSRPLEQPVPRLIKLLGKKV